MKKIIFIALSLCSINSYSENVYDSYMQRQNYEIQKKMLENQQEMLIQKKRDNARNQNQASDELIRDHFDHLYDERNNNEWN
ncbi:MAG TPA: hypothetical protein VNX68_01390 [Nitrosopumilaceae archaeon]|jgi:hypothetical protein|nr:hypothetical protein [Nitrosopumilaceae archaeon]